MKKFKTGLVIGKFWPLHLGHQYLIETALSQSDEVTVIICQCKRYKIEAKIRENWIKELYPKVKTVIINHGKEEDSNSTKVSGWWAKKTIEKLGKVPSVVFSSEKYGIEYAKKMGSGHVMVDIKRKKYNISGSEIRKNTDDNWEYLSQGAKAYLAKRVVVLGVESSGTTTLAKDLAKHYKTCWVPEYGRFYYEGKMWSKNAKKWDSSEFLHIIKQQKEMEEGLAKRCNRVLICDTDWLATTVWHERYVGEKIDQRPTNKNGENNKKLYILTKPDFPFVQDGTRDGEHLRKWMHKLFIEKLEKEKEKYIIVEGSKENRLKKAIKIIDEL